MGSENIRDKFCNSFKDEDMVDFLAKHGLDCFIECRYDEYCGFKKGYELAKEEEKAKVRVLIRLLRNEVNIDTTEDRYFLGLYQAYGQILKEIE